MNVEEAMQKIKDQKSADKDKKELTRQVKQLQSTLKDWEARQFTNVKLIAGLEKENSDLKRRVKDFEENNTGAEEEMYDLNAKCKALEKKEQQAAKFVIRPCLLCFAIRTL